MRSESTPRRLTAKSTTGVTTASQSYRKGSLLTLNADPCPGPSKIRQFHPWRRAGSPTVKNNSSTVES